MREILIGTVTGVILCMLAVVLFYMYTNFSSYRTDTSSDIATCTQEGMICPDGSVVGRSGPKCEFSPCLNISPGLQ